METDNAGKLRSGDTEDILGKKMDIDEKLTLHESLNQKRKEEKLPNKYCPYCGELLGVIIKRKLIKNGKIVLTQHKCRKGGK